jgi:putative NADH-flavin reductase
MKLVVLGPNGRIGKQVVRRALTEGHRVTAIARTPEKVTTAHDDNLTVVPGDVFDQESLDAAIASADAVIFAVGSAGRGPTITRSTGVATVAKVMHANNVARLVVVSPSAVAISPKATLFRKAALRFFVHKLYRNPFNDVERMEDELTHTDLDWSVVRASTLRDTAPTGRYVVVPDGQLRHERPVSVPDLADFLVRHAGDSKARQDIVTVTGSK